MYRKILDRKIQFFQFLSILLPLIIPNNSNNNKSKNKMALHIILYNVIFLN